MKRISSYCIFLMALLAANLCHGQSAKQVIRFGLISDIQYCDCEPRGSRFYRNSIAKLDSCVDAINQQKVQFTLNLGDIIDRNPKDLDTVLKSLSRLDKKVYNTPGNHDYAGVKDNKQLHDKLGMPEEYYSFKKGNWRFIMLNTNEVASYANVAGTWKEGALKQMYADYKAATGHEAADYNGGISSTQLAWLEDQLKASQKKGESVLIFSHHPMSCAKGLTALNDREILGMVAGYKCVKALIAGHHHSGAFCYEGTLPVVVVEGMVETAGQNAYGIVELYPDKLVLKGHGRMLSRTLEFDKP